MRHLMKHHHSSVCQVLQLMPQLPITFPILVRHLTSILWLIETIFSLLKVLESPYTYKRIYLWHYYKWELNLGHEFGTFIQKKQAEAFYNPINNNNTPAPTSTIWSWHWSLLTSSLLRTEMNSASLLAICVALKRVLLVCTPTLFHKIWRRQLVKISLTPLSSTTT